MRKVWHTRARATPGGYDITHGWAAAIARQTVRLFDDDGRFLAWSRDQCSGVLPVAEGHSFQLSLPLENNRSESGGH
jgi:hypothetical protein